MMIPHAIVFMPELKISQCQFYSILVFVARKKNERSQNASSARMRPIYLNTIARAFPDLKIIGAHLGNPWYQEAAEVAR